MGLYGLLLCYGALRRTFFERGQQALAREYLRQEIHNAKLRCRETEQAKFSWNGYRKFEVVKKVVECENVASFYLAPHDKQPLPPFKPGQYITFQVNLPGQPKPLIRCYSLSDSHRPTHYRVTIKKALPPMDALELRPGLVSSHFCDTVREGDILDVKAPAGHFFLELTESGPVVLIAGGIGVTPLVSMLNAVLDHDPQREVWFFFGARRSDEHMFKEHLEQVAGRHKNVRLHVSYSHPRSKDEAGRDYHSHGRVTIDLLKEKLPASNYDYYLCGPAPFMNSLNEGLVAWGVPEKRIHYEAFGPATVKSATAPPTPSETLHLSKLMVTFSRTGQTYHWDPATCSLLEFAESKGVKIEAGCRAGNCGTCIAAIKSGDVSYVGPAGASAEDGTCLTCICRPKTNLIIDA